MSYILAGVGEIQLYNKKNGNLILTSKTLTQSGITIDVSAEDIRGGLSSPLIGKYFHSSAFNLSLTDALFDLQYLALNVGGQISVGGDAITEEQITVDTANTITVSKTVQPFSTFGTIGWYTIAGKNDWKKITFSDKTATVTGLGVGTTVCVRYNATDDALREFIVPTSIIPDECYAILTAPLFQAGSGSDTLSSSSRLGDLRVEIPRFLLNGGQEFSMDMSGASTSNLSGSALASFDGGASCNSGGYYAKIQEIIFGRTPEDDLVNLAIDGADIQMSVDETLPLTVIGIYSDGTTGVFNNERLTFTVDPSTVATVSNKGVITAGSTAGTATIKVVATNKTDIETYGQITVSE